VELLKEDYKRTTEATEMADGNETLGLVLANML
jgi:hypothetical protein